MQRFFCSSLAMEECLWLVSNKILQRNPQLLGCLWNLVNQCSNTMKGWWPLPRNTQCQLNHAWQIMGVPFTWAPLRSGTGWLLLVGLWNPLRGHRTSNFVLGVSKEEMRRLLRRSIMHMSWPVDLLHVTLLSKDGKRSASHQLRRRRKNTE